MRHAWHADELSDATNVVQSSVKLLGLREWALLIFFAASLFLFVISSPFC